MEISTTMKPPTPDAVSSFIAKKKENDMQLEKYRLGVSELHVIVGDEGVSQEKKARFN